VVLPALNAQALLVLVRVLGLLGGVRGAGGGTGETESGFGSEGLSHERNKIRLECRRLRLHRLVHRMPSVVLWI